MKKMVLAIVLSLLLVNVGFAGVWFGGHLGPNFTADSDVDFKLPPYKGTANGVSTNTGFVTGLILGYDFDTKQGFPTWSEYFGVALDFSYNPFTQSAQTFSGSILPARIGTVGIPEVEGYQLALAFLVKAHYPLMKSQGFPKGRLVPYLMAGPAIVWTTSFTNNPLGVSELTSTDLGIVVEPGIQYFIVHNVSVGVSYRYRHVWGPSYDVKLAPVASYLNLDTNLDQHSVLVRFGYHF